MNRSFLVIVLLVFLGFSSSACLNVSTLQTARALKVGEHRVLVGAGMVGGPLITNGDISPSASDAVLWDGAFPYVEVGVRGGVAENLELGGKWTALAGFGVDAKYQFLDRDKFAAAVGVGANLRLIDTKSFDIYPSASHFDVQVPLYLSYDFSKDFSLYGAPRYLFSVGSAHNSNRDAGGNRITELLHLVGSSAGFRVGDSWGFFGEVSVLTAVNKDRLILLQGNGSLYFDLF